MFGSKHGKARRLERLEQVLREASLSRPVTLTQLAARLDVAPSTVLRDLRILEDRRILIQEDEHGGLSLLEQE